MAAGRAIVCSDIAGYRYAVGTGPDCGALLVTPGSSDELSGALAKLAGDPELRDRMGAVNRERVQIFDWQSLVERVREEYCAALEGRGRVLEPPQPSAVAPSTNAAV